MIAAFFALTVVSLFFGVATLIALHHWGLATRQRDRARGIAVELEQQIAAALALHTPTISGRYCCNCDNYSWPCPTRRALDPAVDE